VFPFASPYSLYAGSTACPGNDPANAAYTGGAKTSALAVAGQATPVTLTMQGATVLIKKGGSAYPNTLVNVYASPESTVSMMGGCVDKVSRPIKTDASGNVWVPLPRGVWRMCADVKIGSTWWRGSTGTTLGAATGPIINSPTGSASPYAPLRTTSVNMTSGGANNC
jgi:hypothetical protein